MRDSRTNSLTRVLVAGLVLALWLGLLLPSLDRSRLQNVDELWHARAAQAATLDGHWWPLVLDGRPFFEKPPLVLWLAAATAKASGQPFAAWPYRLWNTLGGALALAAILGLGALAGRFWGGVFAAVLLGLQGDFVYHSRFFTMDTPFLGLGLLAALGMAAALGVEKRAGLWWLAGLSLALAFWCKSWFVLALAPALGAALLSALPEGQRLPALGRLALPLLLAVLAWLALYTAWSGLGFLKQEWHDNLLGRLQGSGNAWTWSGHWDFYEDWVQRAAPAMLPLFLGVPLGLWPRRQDSAAVNFIRVFAWVLPLSWLLGLALVHGETLNYVLPLEAGLALCLGLGLGDPQPPSARAALAALLLLSALSIGKQVPDGLAFIGGGALGLVIAWSRWRGDKLPAQRDWILAAAAGLLLFMLCPDAVGLCLRPLDAHRVLAPFLLAHEPERPGETLWAVDVPTWGVDFYTRYHVLHVKTLAEAKPGEAVLINGPQGLRLIPAPKAP